MSINDPSTDDAVPTTMAMAAPGVQARGTALKLPPLVLDNSMPNPAAVIAGRSMHQIQLEMEYDAEESDNDADHGPSIQGWPGGLERHTSDHPDDLGDLAMREMHALCVFDDVSVPPSARPWSYLIEALSPVPTVRRWGRWRWREEPAFAEVRVAEAIMMYERGIEQNTSDRRCSRCRAGQGISPQCVVSPEGIGQAPGVTGPCSNCLYDGVEHACNASGRRTPVGGSRDRGGESMRDPDKVVDHMAVLEMIAQLKRPSGTRRDHSLLERARRIEAAALQIAQAARDWREKMGVQS
ncbi:uncharacterized protein Triagg1_939 [Trichoderma aggressivum f. europaeum]|uniref:Uncharacterized protein n=1 Tax=Trichoderma aggressivum f. europaeum TaxID=173218 RepID=A0AAE1IMU2_9HYPO|nr:hypothetical protein Triagg1_939 [Trichoderma aggressivum f. europaeum]